MSSEDARAVSKEKPKRVELPPYKKLSEEEKKRANAVVKLIGEMGNLSPVLRPFFLPISLDQFSYFQHDFLGYPLPEFCSISKNILDCFATAVISAPDLQFPPLPLSLRCRLGEQDDRLTLYLDAILTETDQIVDGMVTVSDRILPLEMANDSSVWVGNQLLRLAKVKDIALRSVYWDRSVRQASFFCDYPGGMVRRRVPELGELGKDGKAQWPQCELMIGVIDIRERAKQAIELVEMDDDGIVQ
jgi:hypothetical protein